MTQRRRRRRARRGRFGRRAFLAGAGCAALAGAAVLLGRGQTASASSVPPTDEAEPNAALPTGEWRAVWVSYLEWAGMDFSSEEAFRAGAAELMDNCLSIGLNTVIAQVRPFGDALYRSTLFPWSHLCTGVQGQDPGFDPLDVLITEAHSRGLSLEAWVNPYRLRSSAKMPPALAENNLANVHPEWVCAVGEGLYLNPAIPEAADYVVQGVAELVQNYAVDGIHFDDYFYPTTDAALDAAQFAASGAGDLAAWRRQNVTALVKAAHDAVKAADATLRFGVSPQGNPDNDLGQQYSDVKAWLAAEGKTPWWTTSARRYTGAAAIPSSRAAPASPLRTSCRSGWPCPGRHPRPSTSGWEPIASARGTAVPTRTAGASGVRAALLPGRWNVCTASARAAGRSTGTIRCSGQPSRSLPTPNVRRWPL